MSAHASGPAGAIVPAGDRRGTFLRGRAFVAVEIGVTAAIIAAIWIYTEHSQSPYVPTLPQILSAFRQDWLFSDFGRDLLPSLERLAVGYVISIVIAVPVGIAIGYSRVLRLLTEPVISFLRSTPPPALLPFFIVVIGVGSAMKIAVVAFVCIWPILLNTTDGVASLDETAGFTASVYGMTGVDRLRLLVLPAISPRVFAGLRTSLSLGLLILVVSEMVASTNGIGYFVLEAQATFAVAPMWGGIIMLGLLGYLLNGGFNLVERRALRWHLQTAIGQA